MTKQQFKYDYANLDFTTLSKVAREKVGDKIRYTDDYILYRLQGKKTRKEQLQAIIEIDMAWYGICCKHGDLINKGDKRFDFECIDEELIENNHVQVIIKDHTSEILYAVRMMIDYYGIGQHFLYCENLNDIEEVRHIQKTITTYEVCK